MSHSESMTSEPRRRVIVETEKHSDGSGIRLELPPGSTIFEDRPESPESRPYDRDWEIYRPSISGCWPVVSPAPVPKNDKVDTLAQSLSDWANCHGRDVVIEAMAKWLGCDQPMSSLERKQRKDIARREVLERFRTKGVRR